ncbi:hypothetical protein C8Q80DRAFT_841015 [Daedaleopsis nitida]|nr:hypothetical protein C8Q80DRAFT_841015 [Daedaleopsis nitida]
MHASSSSVTLPPLAPAMNPLPPGSHHPSSSSNSENGTPVPSGSAADSGKKPTAKRKRTGDSNDNGDGQPRTRDGPKKKKANRACFHCQKAHLTCDDSRPCQRCIKRGMADNCTEGHRKKAKYLLDEEELEALKRAKSSEGPSKSNEPPAHSQPPPPTPPEPAPPQQQYISPDAMYPVYSTTGSYGVPAEAANLEYSILSAILGGSPDSGSGGSPAAGHATQPAPGPSYTPAQPSCLSNASWPAEPVQGQYPVGQSGYVAPGAPGFGEQPQLAIQPSNTTLPPSGGVAAEYIAGNGAGYHPAYPAQPDQPGQLAYPDYTDRGQPQGPPQASTSAQRGGYQSPPQSFLVRPRRTPSSPTMSRMAGWTPSLSTPTVENAVQSVYNKVTKGYDYMEGYHFLMKHMSRRFDKNDILRIVRALAIVRPSFIALQMPMSEEDEVFVEKCFQRSLIELDKLVSFSGTPTVAWRRTGEICLVGPEFCMLTGWEREELVGRRKYIYELFENQSVVEYWENFANHAFENTTQSVYSHCVLLKPSGAPVPCTFCFSIRRDIMDLPSLVIGQWLPLI